MTMTAGELYEILRDMDIETYEWPITVAFRWKGETVISDIVSAKINGKTIQLNEEDFLLHCSDVMSEQKKYEQELGLTFSQIIARIHENHNYFFTEKGED